MPYYESSFVGTPTTRAVALNTAYTPSLEFVTNVMVPGFVSHGASSDGELRLQISPDNFTTTYVVDSFGGAGIRDALGTAGTDRGTLQYDVPPTWQYRVVSVTNNGSPTFALGTAVEQLR